MFTVTLHLRREWLRVYICLEHLIKLTPAETKTGENEQVVSSIYLLARLRKRQDAVTTCACDFLWDPTPTRSRDGSSVDTLA